MNLISINRRVRFFVNTGLFRLERPENDLFRCWRVRPRSGLTSKRMFEQLRLAQDPDTRHHAPCCPANRWSGQELVFQLCTCGARH